MVYDPTRNDIFCATKGRGAYMNERRIRVAKRTHLQDCLLSTGFPYRPGDKLKMHLSMLGDIIPQCAGVRRPGAAALDLAYVAAGFSDGFFELGLQPWDVAAGSLLVTEAGGLVGNFTGESEFLHEGECVAGNPRIYGQLVGTLGKYSKFAGTAKPKASKGALARANTTADRDEASAARESQNQTEVQAAFEKASNTLTARPKRIKPASVTKPAEGAPEATF